MEYLKLNETPVRTSRNFNINNIKLENVEIPETIPEFNNIDIQGITSQIDIKKETINTQWAYGLNEILKKQVMEQANQMLKLTTNCKANEHFQIGFKFDNKNSVLIDNISIIANEDTKTTIIIKYASDDDIKAFHNGAIRVSAKENSTVNIILVNLINTKSNNFISI